MPSETPAPAAGTPTSPITHAAGGSLVEKVKGKAQEAVGTVLGDDQLVVEGKLHTAKAAAADDVADLAQTATLKQAQADLTAREQRAEAEQQRVAAEVAADQAERRIATEQADRDAVVENDAAAARAGAESTRQQRIAHIDKDEFDAARSYRAGVAEADDIAAEARRVRLSARLPTLDAPSGGGVAGRLRALPGQAVATYLSVLRLPVAAYERRAGDTSSVSVAFERFDGRLRNLAGSLLRDPALLAEARRENIEVGRLGEAAELDAAAKAKRAKADDRLAGAKKSASAAKANAASAAESQVEGANSREQSAKVSSRTQAARATATSQASARSREAAVATSERAGEASALREEQQALAAERAMLGRESDVVRLDDAVDVSKSDRARH